MISSKKRISGAVLLVLFGCAGVPAGYRPYNMQAGAGRLKREPIKAIHDVGDFASGGAEACAQYVVLREIVVKVRETLLDADAPLIIIGGGFNQTRGINALFTLAAKHKISLESCAGGGGPGDD